MDRGAHSQWERRETRRAELLHKIFIRVAGMGLTYPRMYRQARKLAGTGMFFNSYKGWERHFLAWRKDPRPETLRRKYGRRARESTARVVREVELLALACRITLREAYIQLAPPLTYLTIFRHSKNRLKIARLVEIRTSQGNLARAEKSILRKITGGKRA